MEAETQHVLAEALKLPAEAREDVAVRLLGSVVPSDVELDATRIAWNEEIDRRIAKLDRGESAAVPIDDAWPRIAGRAWQVNPNVAEADSL